MSGSTPPDRAAPGDAAREEAPAHSASLVALCLASVYLAWGSTYLAIRIALTSLPPFLLAGVRALVAGSLLLAWSRWKGGEAASRRALANAALVGLLMVAGGNGLVTWAEQWVSSGLAAAIAASGSMWLVLILSFLGERPTRGEQLGIAIGFAGVVLLNLEGELRASPAGALGLLGATWSWAAGSALTRRLELPKGALFVAVQLLAGGAAMTLGGLLGGERIDPSMLSVRGLAAWAYLIVAGSLVGFSAFTFLIRNVRPALATSFVYVNPVVAVFLGAALLGERVSPVGCVGVTVSVFGLAAVSLASRTRR